MQEDGHPGSFFIPNSQAWVLSLNKAFTNPLGEKGGDLLPTLSLPPHDPIQSSGISQGLISNYRIFYSSVLFLLFLPHFQALFLPRLPACQNQCPEAVPGPSSVHWTVWGVRGHIQEEAPMNFESRQTFQGICSCQLESTF